ncbi:MAG: thioredoxin domain-containing protein [Magnetococcales bacterium]|nr:thioredoxin domain-containing protein [Magnetococcales bacterium]
MRQVDYRLLLFFLFFLFAGLGPCPILAADAPAPSQNQAAEVALLWHPWNAATVAQAKQEQKLIFLAITALPCPLCRHMEQESLRDPATVALLNQQLISIRVDRDDYPDLDSYFRLILAAMTGQSGWPVQMILTPDLQPLYGGSFFPLQANAEQVTLKTVLTALLHEWQQERKPLLARLGKLSDWLVEQQNSPTSVPADTPTDPRPLVANSWRSRFDSQHATPAGRHGQTPQPVPISLLLRQAATQKQLGDALPALLALEQMAAGSIRDQLAGAFFRASQDARWQIPFFDILLPDNALLARSYLEAFQLTGRRDYALVAQEILDDLLARLQLSGGCFAASLSSDPETANRYYTWSAEEIRATLGEQADSFLELTFDPIEGTIDGRSVLRLLAGLASSPGNPEEWQSLRERLRHSRAQRATLQRDERIITSWNGLTISVLARAGALLQQERYLSAARSCLHNLQQAFPTPESLRHNRLANRNGTTLFLDDYAYLAQAMIDLYEAEFSPSLLDQAEALLQEVVNRFQASPEALFTLTATADNPPLAPRILWQDGPYPSGLSVALTSMQRLALFRQGGVWEKTVASLRPLLLQRLTQQPQAAAEAVRVWDYLPESAVEIVVVGERNHPDTQAMLQEIRQRLLPGLALALVEPEAQKSHHAWPLLAQRPMMNGKPTAYVCRQQLCRMPVNRISDLLRELDGNQLPAPLLLPPS